MKVFRKQQNGFTLALALVFAGVLAATLANLSFVQKGENQRREAEIAGIEGAEIARAARIFARNEFVANANLAADLDPAGGTGPRLIGVNELIDAALLPPNFARENGGNYFNALGQPIRIFLANYPIDGFAANPNTTVPTAYVIFDDTTQTTPETVQDIIQSIRAEDVAISAPVYSAGVNLTGACNAGGDTVAIWETGCLNTNDYATLTGGAYQPGTLIIPVWRAVNFDTRAMIRFPQPEQTGLQTMFTNLEMANMQDCSGGANFIQVTTDAGDIDTQTCNAFDDAGVDNRRDIINIDNINTLAVLVDPQAAGTDVGGVELTTTSPTGLISPTDLNITNDLTITNGDTKIFNGNTNVGLGTIADRNISVSTQNGFALPATASIGGTLNAGNATSTEVNVVQTFDGNLIGISNSMNNTNEIDVANDFVIQDLTRDASAPPLPPATPGVTVTNNANIGGNLAITGLTIRGDRDIQGYSMVTGNLTVQDINISNNLNSQSLIDVVGTLDTDAIAITDGLNNARCIGDCPRRVAEQQCTNLQNSGLLTSNGFVDLQDCIENL